MKIRTIALVIALTVSVAIPVSQRVEIKVEAKKPVVVQTKATPIQKKYNKALARRYAQAGWGWDKVQQNCIYLLFMKESKYDNFAKNKSGSSAYGIAQMLGEKSSDPAIQLLHAYRYIKHRYTNPCSALRHHKKGWY